MTAMLAASGLTSGYGEAIVIRDIGFEVAPGEIVAVLGKNGMGKTTLLRTIMGFLAKEAGRVSVHGRDISAIPPHRIAQVGVGYVAQEKALFQDLTVEENIRLAVRSRSPEEALRSVEETFPFLLRRLTQRAGTLSGGEQKMLLMARALATGAELILVDEITEGLQPTMVERIATVIRQAREKHGTSFLLVEQHLNFALGIADRYLVMQGGEIVLSGETSSPDAANRIARYLSV